jgi:tetratricopeptide (TPR) repeat protein
LTQRKDRWLDIAIRVSVVAIVALIAWIGYLFWANSQTQAVSSPVGRAVENLRKIVGADPGNADARIRLAEALAFAGRLDDAVTQFDAALKIRPDYMPALSGLASVAMQRRDYKTAETYWLKIISMLENVQTAAKDQQLDTAYYGLGVTYIDMKRYEEAVTALKDAVRIKADASDTHYMLSVAYRELKYPDKQKEELNITLAFDPNNAQANYDLGLLILKEGDIPAAADLFRISVDHAPTSKATLPQKELDKLAAKGDAKTRLARARALFETKPADALTEARIAAALDPVSTDAVRLVAQLWEKQGNKERALNAWKRLLEMSVSDAEADQAIKRLSPDVK